MIDLEKDVNRDALVELIRLQCQQYVPRVRTRGKHRLNKLDANAWIGTEIPDAIYRDAVLAAGISDPDGWVASTLFGRRLAELDYVVRYRNYTELAAPLRRLRQIDYLRPHRANAARKIFEASDMPEERKQVLRLALDLVAITVGCRYD